MDDQELRRQLARGPLARQGFNEELRRRINEEIDRPRRRPRLFWVPLTRLGGAFAVVFAVLAGAWIWQAQSSEQTATEMLHEEQLEQSPPAAASVIEYTEELPRSVMLIGLRKDDPRLDTSGYRSILVAPEGNQLTANVKLEGIYMPYKMKFYRLDNAVGSHGKGIQMIASSLAGQPQPVSVEIDSAYRTNEKVLFAGNKYVALQQTRTEIDSGITTTHYWVKDVEQLTAAARQARTDVEEEPHYSLGGLVPQSNLQADEWTIVRHDGRWTGNVPARQVIGITLPVEVSSYDTLWLNWDEIRAREPAAIDAYTSPTQDLLAVQTDDAISVYAYRMRESDMKPITIPLEDGEDIVMVQWAQDGYVDIWKQTLSQWIATAQDD